MMVEFESPTNCDVCGEVWDAAGWVSCPRCQVTETKARVAELVADVERRRERERRLESERDHARQASTIDRARVAELEAAVRTLVGHHSGACCTFDAFNKVIVTQTSCKCPEPIHLARILVGEWRTPSVGTSHSPELLELAKKAVESQKAREGEDVEAWATKLADSVPTGDEGTRAVRPSEARCSGCGRGSDSIERCVLCKRGIRPNDATAEDPDAALDAYFASLPKPKAMKLIRIDTVAKALGIESDDREAVLSEVRRLRDVRVDKAMAEGRWRVGTKLGRTLYFDDKCVGIVDNTYLACELVAAVNARAARTDYPRIVEQLREKLKEDLESFKSIRQALREKHYDGAWSVTCCSFNVLERMLDELCTANPEGK